MPIRQTAASAPPAAVSSPPFAALCNEELPIRPSRASPELHQSQPRKRYGAPNDLWALGTVFAEVACGNRDPNVYMMIQELESTSEEVFASNLPMLSVDARDLLREARLRLRARGAPAANHAHRNLRRETDACDRPLVAAEVAPPGAGRLIARELVEQVLGQPLAAPHAAASHR